MRDARYLRAQAELCLQIARQISDSKAAEQLRVDAARYHDEAAAIEGMEPSGPVSLPRRIDGGVSRGVLPDRGEKGNPPMDGTIAVIARGFRSLWLSSAAPRPQNTLASPKVLQRSSNRPTIDREAAKRGYSFEYTNGSQIIQEERCLQFSSDRAAKREAMRTARHMANNVSWQSSARGPGWTVLVINPIGQQVCEVPVAPCPPRREAW